MQPGDTLPIKGNNHTVPVNQNKTVPRQPRVRDLYDETDVLDEEELAQAVTSKKKWQHGTQKTVKFLTNHPSVEVRLVSSQDPSLETILAEMVDGNPMVLDLEWFCWVKPQVINCYQICSTRGVVVIHDINPDPNEIICNFLSAESGNKFIAKGCGCDYKMLHERFGPTFRIYMEDVHVTRLAPNNLSVNFENMIEMFAGPSTATFKNKKVTTSNWSATELSVQQVLYAAFDVFSLYQCIPNFPEPSRDPYSSSIPKKLRRVMDIADSPQCETPQMDPAPMQAPIPVVSVPLDEQEALPAVPGPKRKRNRNRKGKTETPQMDPAPFNAIPVVSAPLDEQEAI